MNQTASTKLNSNAELSAVIEAHQLYVDQSSPYNSPKAGETNALLPNLSPNALADDNKKLAVIYERLTKIEKASLSEENQINYAVLAYSIKNQLDSYENK